MMNLVPESVSKAAALFAKTQGLTLDKIEPAHIQQAAELMGFTTSAESVSSILTLAQSADQKTLLLDWARAKFEDGTFARVFNPPPKSILHRCEFCGQPNTVPLGD